MSNTTPKNHTEPFIKRLVLFLLAMAAIVAGVLIVTVPLGLNEQALFGAILFVVVLLISRIRTSLVLLFMMAIAVIVSSRYLYWRFTNTVLLDRPIEVVLAIILLAAECYCFVVMILGFLQSMWPMKRPPVPIPGDPSTWPTVDVFIPTYSEPLAVVRTTVLAAKAMDWPEDKINIYLLDDGRREEFRKFALQAGIHYMTRPDNKHAKAGNINNAMQRSRGEFVAVFDCDHVPTRSFLQLTMGWLVRDPTIAMVQTPHHFNSPDPFERNLKTFRKIPNEGELFYGLLLPGDDLWNAVFFCGSCGVLRRTALDQIGGVAVETVTEDCHTGLRLHRKGFSTAYINIPQASGLATESLSAHVGQRIRWARGMVQIFRSDNPLFGRGLTLMQRLCYSSAMIHFLNGLPRLIFLMAPMAYLFFQFNLFRASAVAVLAYALPHLAHSILTNSRAQGKYRHSFWAEVYETVLATYIMIPTMLALINPRLGKFNVTAKGGIVKQSYMDRKISWPYILLFLANLAGIVIGVWRIWDHQPHRDAVMINIGWAIYNVVILGAAIAVAYESKQLRRFNRVEVRLPAMLRLDSGYTMTCRTRDLALKGALVELTEGAPTLPQERLTLSLILDEQEVLLPADIVAQEGNKVRLTFPEMSLTQESGLVQAIYSRSDAWVRWNDSRLYDRVLLSWARILGHSLRGFARLFGRSARSAA